MPLSIKDEQTDALARRLVSLTGETLTVAVKEALRERLEREERRVDQAGRAARLLAIGRRCAAHVREPRQALDHGDLLYDEQGLPR
jgi:antitoxin VapB